MSKEPETTTAFSAAPRNSAELVLASGSPRRRELLATFGVSPIVRPVDIDETPRSGELAAAYVERLARAKAQATGAPGELVLAADTVVAISGDLLGKPRDANDAARMLRQLSGRGHRVLTGVAVWEPETRLIEVEVAITEVEFRDLTAGEIEAYVSSGEPMDKAGAYAIQGLAAVFVQGIVGDYSNIVGLPLPVVYRLLLGRGIDLLASAATRPSSIRKRRPAEVGA